VALWDTGSSAGLVTATPDGLQITDERRRALEFFRERSVFPLSTPLPSPPPEVGMDVATLIESLRRSSEAKGKMPAQGGLLDFVASSAEGVKGVEVKGGSSDGAENG